MTIREATGEMTGAGMAENANIRIQVDHTMDRVAEGPERQRYDRAEVESSGLTSGETVDQFQGSGARPSERDVLMAEFRAAQASALFDPEAMALLESLARKPLFDLAQLSEEIRTPAIWVKLAVLMRAFLVEPMDSGVRVSLKGSQALEKLRGYLSRLESENQTRNHGEGL